MAQGISQDLTRQAVYDPALATTMPYSLDMTGPVAVVASISGVTAVDTAELQVTIMPQPSTLDAAEPGDEVEQPVRW